MEIPLANSTASSLCSWPSVIYLIFRYFQLSADCFFDQVAFSRRFYWETNITTRPLSRCKPVITLYTLGLCKEMQEERRSARPILDDGLTERRDPCVWPHLLIAIPHQVSLAFRLQLTGQRSISLVHFLAFETWRGVKLVGIPAHWPRYHIWSLAIPQPRAFLDCLSMPNTLYRWYDVAAMATGTEDSKSWAFHIMQRFNVDLPSASNAPNSEDVAPKYRECAMTGTALHSTERRPNNQLEEKTSYCNVCNLQFCDSCWEIQPTHIFRTLGMTGVPHEKTDPDVAEIVKATLEVNTSDDQQQDLHVEDQDTTWFGIVEENGEQTFRDYGRYSDLMACFPRPQEDRCYPGLVSFVGPTGMKMNPVSCSISHYLQVLGRVLLSNS